MIKLVATDLDGTFLNETRGLMTGAEELLDELEQKQIAFVAASGRSLRSIERVFGDEVVNKIGIVAENGSVVAYKGTVINVCQLDIHMASEIATLLLDMKVNPLVNTVHNSFSSATSIEFNKNISYYCSNLTHVDSFSQVPDEVVKIAINVPSGETLPVYNTLMEKWGDQTAIAISGDYWLDVMPKATNKSVGLEILLDKLGINSEEIVTFGDYDNDIELLKLGKYSYAMIHANDRVKKHAKAVCEQTEIFNKIRALI
ncbi:MAG: hypothetical protein ATN33_02380 [Epulopiscium sp. Nele67-Bin001]|nr:MAG: hypothetical protein BEN18_01050 [Epulopiscium sp. Nuni2H_MBin001]OON90683.1 MAG: hypothetical protein ATN33_02380 [Epulopiscium sp. Nele67-Bin001]